MNNNATATDTDTSPDFRDIIGYEALADYLTAEYGNDLAVFRDGSVQIVQSNSSFRREDAPVARVKCPGVGNLDTSVFADGFVDFDEDAGVYATIVAREDSGRIRVVGDLAAVIMECCRDGDVSRFYDDLIAALEDSAAA